MTDNNSIFAREQHINRATHRLERALEDTYGDMLDTPTMSHQRGTRQRIDTAYGDDCRWMAEALNRNKDRVFTIPMEITHFRLGGQLGCDVFALLTAD